MCVGNLRHFYCTILFFVSLERFGIFFHAQMSLLVQNCVFKHEDACYTLAFSTMMLQTALHNPQAGRSMDLASFTRMNHDMNCQTDEKGDLHPKWDPEDRWGVLFRANCRLSTRSSTFASTMIVCLCSRAVVYIFCLESG